MSEPADSVDLAILKRREKYQHLSRKTNKLTFLIRHSYCAPQLATLPVITLLSVYLNSFYESIGANLAYISFFIALARSLDVLSDPLISYLTDSFRSHYGRRRPFCFSGCWVYAISLILLLSPPDSLQEVGVSMWFGLCYVAFFLCNAFVAIPYDALGPELTDNYEDRSKLFFVAGMYDGLGVLIAVILPAFIVHLLTLSGTNCDGYDSCFNTNGIGRSCMPNPATGLKASFAVFNATTWTPMHYGNETYNNPSSFFMPEMCRAEIVTANPLYNYCDCVNECSSLCSIDNSRSAYRIVGILYGIWMVISMINMVYWVKERSMLNDGHELEEAPPIVPSIFNTMRNRAFMSLLPAWACDAVAQAMLSTMMTFFVQYVIRPEYQTSGKDGIDCNEGVPIEGQESDSWRCKSNIVLGAIISCMLVFAFVAIPGWLLLCQYFGKRKTWLMWSLAMAVVILLFSCVGEGDVVLAICMGGLAGTTLGAKFLSDSIVADIIDYDEFLTGQRNEATYTMFKSFLPKICAIPAAAAPIAILNAIGQVPSVNGQIQIQPEQVKIFCILATTIIPAIFCFLSFYFKLSFPLRTKEQTDMISEGIGLHMLNKPARDPLTGVEYTLDIYTPKERKIINLLDHFPSLADAESLQSCLAVDRVDVAVSSIIYRMRDWAAICFFFITASIVAVAVTVPFLSDDVFSILPILSIISLGLSLTMGVLSTLRLKASASLLQKKNIPEVPLLDRVVAFRRIIDHIHTVDVLSVAKVGSEGEGEGDEAEAAKLKQEHQEMVSLDREVVDTWKTVLGVPKGAEVEGGEDEGKEKSLTELFAESILKARALTVWEVELCAFVREQAAKNAAAYIEEGVEESAAESGTDSDSHMADSESSTSVNNDRRPSPTMVRPTVPSTPSTLNSARTKLSMKQKIAELKPMSPVLQFRSSAGVTVAVEDLVSKPNSKLWESVSLPSSVGSLSDKDFSDDE